MLTSSSIPSDRSENVGTITTAVIGRDGKRERNEYRFRCPNLTEHTNGDQRPSARWNPDKAVWHCDACKQGGGATDLATRLEIPHPARSTTSQSARKGRLEATYQYRAEDNSTLFEVLRFGTSDGNKSFSQRRPDGDGGYIHNLQGIETVLYRLPELMRSTDTVWIVEGEKCADRLHVLGLIATTCPMGAGKWRSSYTATLAGRDVVICADNDVPGKKHATDIAAQLSGAGCRVRLVEFPDLPHKGDVVDFLAAGKTLDDLLKLVKQAPEWRADPDATEREQGRTGTSTITAVDLMTKTFPAPRWAVEGFFPEGVSLLVGPPKLGKSWLALDVAVAVAAGGRALGQIPVDQGDVLYLALEDTQRRLQERLGLVLNGADAPARLEIATEWPTLLEGGGEQLDDWLDQHPEARLVIVDTFVKLRGASPGPRNSILYQLDYQAVGDLKRIADRHGVALIVIHHTRKAVADDPLDMVSGTNGLAGSADTVLILKRDIGRADATLYVRGRDVPEADHALRFDPVACTWSLIGDAAEYRLSAERQEILDVLRKAGEELTPKRIATILGKTPESVRFLLHKMAKAGEIEGTGGKYRPPNSANDANATAERYRGLEDFGSSAIVSTNTNAAIAPIPDPSPVSTASAVSASEWVDLG